jgi:hypothetical protein
MERKPFTLERKTFIWSELFIGNWDLFQKVLSNPETIFVYDIDGILANSADKVLKKFSDEYGIATDPAKINGWGYLTGLAKAAGWPAERIEHAEDYWYDPQLLLEVRKYLYIKPVVSKTIGLFGAERNYVLTSRNPEFKDLTLKWLAREYPEILAENIMIRDNKKIDPAEFKAKCLWWLAKTAPWVIFIDDATDFVKSALNLKIDNLVAVNIPQGTVMPDFSSDQLVVIKRYPEEIQAMYPLMYAIDKAINGRTSVK